MIRKLLLVLAVLVIGWVTVDRVRWALASDETRIRWAIQDMAEGFDAQKTNKVLSGFTEDFKDAGTGVGRDELHGALVHLFFTEIDPETKRFRLRVEIPDDELEVEVNDADAEGRKTADVRLLAHFLRSISGGGSELGWWDARVHARMVETDDGWRFDLAHEVNHDERPRLP